MRLPHFSQPFVMAIPMLDLCVLLLSKDAETLLPLGPGGHGPFLALLSESHFGEHLGVDRVGPLDLLRFTLRRPMPTPMQGFFQLRNRQRVLAALKLRGLVVF